MIIPAIEQETSTGNLSEKRSFDRDQSLAEERESWPLWDPGIPEWEY